MYQRKKYNNALKDLKNFKVEQMDSTTLHTYELLHQWRERLAKHVDEEPKNLMSVSTIVKLAAEKPKNLASITTIISSFGPVHKDVKPTINTILRILTEQDEFVSRMNKSLCQNCMNRGHIWGHCPFEKNKNRLREYRKINPEYGIRQNRRRRENKKLREIAIGKGTHK